MVRKAIQTKLDGVNGDEITARDAVGRKVTVPYAFDQNESDNHIMAAQVFFTQFGLTSDFLTGYLGGSERVYVHILQENR